MVDVPNGRFYLGEVVGDVGAAAQDAQIPPDRRLVPLHQRFEVVSRRGGSWSLPIDGVRQR